MNINSFEIEWMWGRSVTVMIDNCGSVVIEFVKRYYYGYVTDLKVAPDRRREGIATALMTKAEEVITDNGFDESQLKVQKDHTFQFEWYKRLGYKVVFEDDDYYYMRKHLINGKNYDGE